MAASHPPTRLRAHAPPHDRFHRAVLVLPFCAGAIGVVLVAAQMSSLERAAAGSLLLFAAWATLSFGPMAGVALWERVPWRRYRRRGISLTDKTFRAFSSLTGRGGPPLEIESVSSARPDRESFLLLTPSAARASWPVEAGKDDMVTPPDSYRASPAPVAFGVVRFFYHRDMLSGGRIQAWIMTGVALVALIVSGIGSDSYLRLLLLPPCLAHSIVSFAYLVHFARGPVVSGMLEISRGQCSFLVSERGRIRKTLVSPSVFRGRSEIPDPSGLTKRRFVLPSGSLSRGTQLKLIEQLLPVESDGDSALLAVRPQLVDAKRARAEK